jgi:hypothetical protein
MQSPANIISPSAIAVQENAWLVLTALMFLAWWAWFARKHSDDFSLSERLMAAFIGTICQIVLTTVILGSFGILYWWPLGLFNAAIATALAVVSIRARGGRSLWGEVRFALTETWALLRSSCAIWAFGVMSLLLSIWVIYLGQLLPSVGYDSWGYHFLWAATAHQNGNIGYESISDPMIGVYPWNTDILFLWWIIGAWTERWSNIAQAPFAFVSALACYRLARNAGARKVDAAIAGLLVFSVPTVFHQMWVAYVDLAVMGATLASIAFLSRKQLTPAALAVAGASAGFMVGTKGTGMYLFIGLFLLFLYRLVPLGMDALKDHPGGRLKGMLWTLIWFGGFTFLLGSYFYIRNWIHYGNPLGIYTLQIGPLMIFKGSIDPTVNFGRAQFYAPLYEALHSKGWLSVVFDGFFDPQSVYAFEHRIGGWGADWTILMLPAIPVVFVWSLLRRKWPVAAIMLACIIPYIIFKWDHTNTRYHLQLIGAGTTAFAFLLSALWQTHFRRLLIATAGALMVLILFIAGLGVANPNLIAGCRAKPYRERDRTIGINYWGEPHFAEVLRSVEAPGTTLAYNAGLPDHKSLAFWNMSFTNRAFIVEWNNDGEQWLSNLRGIKANAVYISPDAAAAIAYANSSPAAFTPLYQGSKGAIYKLSGGAR